MKLWIICAIVGFVTGEEDSFFKRSVELILHKLDNTSKTKFTNFDTLFEMPKHSKELLFQETSRVKEDKPLDPLESIDDPLPNYHLRGSGKVFNRWKRALLNRLRREDNMIRK